MLLLIVHIAMFRDYLWLNDDNDEINCISSTFHIQLYFFVLILVHLIVFEFHCEIV